ncbi:hypothetical protein LTR85_000133 [Meristemomyces frigidus]|nr:hypothetical protein LTR85_000133 [Meristemomyces frigidus]
MAAHTRATQIRILLRESRDLAILSADSRFHQTLKSPPALTTVHPVALAARNATRGRGGKDKEESTQDAAAVQALRTQQAQSHHHRIVASEAKIRRLEREVEVLAKQDDHARVFQLPVQQQQSDKTRRDLQFFRRAKVAALEKQLQEAEAGLLKGAGSGEDVCVVDGGEIGDTASVKPEVDEEPFIKREVDDAEFVWRV